MRSLWSILLPRYFFLLGVQVFQIVSQLQSNPTAVKRSHVMEHLPTVHGAPPLPVPFLSPFVQYGDEPRGYSGFRHFPALCGYESDNINLSGESGTKTVALLQTWLLFGLLTEAFGGKPMYLKATEFTRITETGDRLITTELLPKYFWYWQARRQHDDREEVVKHAKELDRCMSLANSVFHKVAAQAATLDAVAQDTWTQRSVVLLSLATTVEYICEARRRAVGYTDSLTNSVKTLSWRIPSLQRALRCAGWCPGETTQLMKNCNATCLYYLSLVGRKNSGKNHEGCSNSEGCKALRIDYGNYKLLHIGTNHTTCDCKPVGPRIREVAAVLDRGSLPIVAESLTGACELLELDMTYPRNYVAISHVWSDGLGNPKENRLNACAFRHIQRLVNALYDPKEWPVPFWIDTMCIPPQENHTPEQKELRKKGITRMAETYAQADKVLVLDNSLQGQQGSIPLIEMSVRIRHAPWTTRVWTLQEGRLGKSLYFQFKDRAISVDLLDDIIRSQRNVATALDLVDRTKEEDRIMSNESAVRLVRAFATLLPPNPAVEYYTTLPPQEDSVEENNRLIALAIARERAELEPLRLRWARLIERHDLRKALSEADELLAADMRAIRVDLVCDYGLNIIKKIRGYGYQHIVQSGNALSQDDEYPSASLLYDTCQGFRGRTTSRLEDETVCLGILLRVRNIRAILDIETLPWRWGKLLRTLGKQHIISRCHEMRMKALLSQIEAYEQESVAGDMQRGSYRDGTRARINALPQTIIFWNVPRLGSMGWNWAPFSLLHPSLDYDVRQGGRYGRVTRHGLEVRLSAFALKLWEDSYDVNFSQTIDAYDAILVIHAEHDRYPDRHPWRQTWQRIRLRRDDYTRSHRSPSPFISWVKGGIIGQMVILMEHTRIEDAGVMIQEYGMDGDVHLTRHVALLERISKDERLGPGTCELHVWGEWISDGKWRVG
jgi:Heterokaryon incompatibility protein (HET)